jgi:hypothetical protein
MPDQHLTTTLPRAVLGLAVGALVGACLVEAQTVTVAMVFGQAADVLRSGYFLAVAFLMSLMVWGTGLVGFGAPLWVLLHKLRKRSVLSAAMLGLVLAFAVNFAFETIGQLWWLSSGTAVSSGDSGGWLVKDNQITVHGVLMAFIRSCIIGVQGALVAMSIWRVAYRRVRIAETA